MGPKERNGKGRKGGRKGKFLVRVQTHWRLSLSLSLSSPSRGGMGGEEEEEEEGSEGCKQPP